MTLKERVNKIFSKLDNWHKKAILVMGVILVTQFFTPYIIGTYNFFANSYKVQRDYEKINTRLNNLEDYVEVLNYIIDGISETRYHRGVRYLITRGIDNRPDDFKSMTREEQLRWDLSHCDWYYLGKDVDGIRKWLGASYSAEYDTFSYIDHDGVHHKIKAREKSLIKRDY